LPRSIRRAWPRASGRLKSNAARRATVRSSAALIVGAQARAQAAFTPAEKTPVQNLLWAAYLCTKQSDNGSLHDGVNAVLDPVTRDRTNAATRAALKKVWDLTVSAQKDFGFAFADLAGANIAPRGQPRQFQAARNGPPFPTRAQNFRTLSRTKGDPLRPSSNLWRKRMTGRQGGQCTGSSRG
jgi:hypothetical protein